MKFIVGVKEVHTQFVTVEAETAEEAVKKAAACEGQEAAQTEFEYTLKEDTWTVEPVEDEK